MKTSKYLFLFTVGPVQSFIAQARKTQDLYAGSRILSDLIGYAMNKLEALAKSVDVVFPNQSAESKPNRFTAIVELKEGGDMQAIGRDLQKSVLEYFVNTLGKDVMGLYKEAKPQLEDFLKIYWLAAEYNGDEDQVTYGAQVKKAEKFLAASKNIRYFNQFGEVGRKCSLNGEYNVKFYRKTEDDKNNEHLKSHKLFSEEVCILDFNFRKENGKHSGLSYSDIQAGEGLCAISMMKRFYKDKANEKTEKEEFPSTAEIATLETRERLMKLGNTVLSSNINCLLKFNSQFLYEEAITEKNIKKVLSEDGQECPIDLIPQWQCNIAKAAKDNNLKLSKYYAILVFDADGMGSKIGKCEKKEHVEILSKALADYGKWATEYINGKNEDKVKKGKTVYAGGDDFLGFMNLNHLFPALETMRKEFDKQVNARVKSELGNEYNKDLELSFSAGIAIAHYKTPLSEVLNYARLMEKKAKSVECKDDEKVKKDAFAIAVLKHSGEIQDTVWRFKSSEGDEAVWATSTINDLIHHLCNKDVSDKFMTNLAEEFEPMLNKKGTWGQEDISTDTDEAVSEKLNEILNFELERFMKRADSKAGNGFKASHFAKKLYALYKQHTHFHLKSANNPLSVQNFINLLFISEFISRDINKTSNINQPSPQ